MLAVVLSFKMHKLFRGEYTLETEPVLSRSLESKRTTFDFQVAANASPQPLGGCFTGSHAWPGLPSKLAGNSENSQQ